MADGLLRGLLRRMPRGMPGAAACAAVLVCAGATAAPVGPALDRPALIARDPAHTVLLGAAHAGPRLVAVGERGIVLLSDDAGASWRQAPTPVSVTLTAVRFADAQHGFAVGHGGVVLGTDDGGQRWARRLDGMQAAKLALQAAQATGDARAVRDAQRLVADGADKPLLDLHVFDAQRAIVVGAYGLALATADGGRSWRSLMGAIDNPKGLHLYAVRARGDTVLLAGEQGLALRSSDGGRSFQRLELPYKGSFFTAEAMGSGNDGRHLVLAGLRGNVWQSADGGASWAQWKVPVPASITASALQPAAGANAQQALLLVNQAGLVMKASGDTITSLPGAPLPPLNGLLPLAGGRLLVLSVAGPRVIDGGAP